MQHSVVAVPMPVAAFCGANIDFPPSCFVSLLFSELKRLLRLQEKMQFCATGVKRRTCGKVRTLDWGFRWRGDYQNWPGCFWCFGTSVWAGSPGAP